MIIRLNYIITDKMTKFLLKFLTLLKIILIKVRNCIFNISNPLKNVLIFNNIFLVYFLYFLYFYIFI